MTVQDQTKSSQETSLAVIPQEEGTPEADNESTPSEAFLRQEASAFKTQESSNLVTVVGLGGSAGSIAVLQDFFQHVRTDLGVAYVVVIHLAADYSSALPDILQSRTTMPVTQVTGSVTVQPNHVYVIPPSHHLLMQDGQICLTDPQKERGRRVAVDMFFRSLASTHRSRAVAIVLSGADGDGAIGIKRIKEHGGLTIVQDPVEAEQDSMPRAALETGMVDWVLPAAQMPERLAQFVENERNIQLPDDGELPETAADKSKAGEKEHEAALREVLSFLRSSTGHDFSHYKRATIVRRIGRRLQVNSLTNIPAYNDYLRTHPGEAGALLQDLLISVTNFFRDPGAFHELEAELSKLIQNRAPQDDVRIWVPGCATGEEAYSLAMVLMELGDQLTFASPFQIFATDLDEQALRVAREGVYPSTIVADVSPARLKRFFIAEKGRYHVKKELRDHVLFAAHNLLSDSPFSRLDLVSCRNVLIYFNKQAQDRVLDLFHFALRPGGLLFLGSSESADDSALFSVLEKRSRIYRREGVPAGRLSLPTIPLPMVPMPILPVSVSSPTRPGENATASPESKAPQSLSDLHQELLAQAMPPSVLVNQDYEILHLSPGAGRYLRFAGGEVSVNLLAVAPPTMRLELRAALFRVVTTGVVADIGPSSVEINGEQCMVAVRLCPYHVAADKSESGAFVLVIFEEQLAPDARLTVPVPAPADVVAERLEAELQKIKSDLRSSVEQYEASVEELKASNEELQAMNEEQRSATEELETSREEIQAANEELVTLNAELKGKIEEISRANSDLQNLMASTEIATVFLTRDLRIKRYTPQAIELFRLIPTDTGRPLADLRHCFDHEDFAGEAEEVLRTLATKEREVQSDDGRWFLLRMSAYRTEADMIDGIVLTFLDISQQKHSEEDLIRARDELESRVEIRTRELAQALKRVNAEMKERRAAEEGRDNLMGRLVASQEEERRRIARDLHDNLGQQLSAVLLALHALEEKEKTAVKDKLPATLLDLRKLYKLIDDLLQAGHRQAWELRPPELDDIGLEVALRRYVEDWAQRSGVKLDFQVINWQEDLLVPGLETTFYRVVQEALTNVLRHARATNVSVILEMNDSYFSAIVEDNGTGFSPTADHKGRLGLLGMRERLAIVHGTLDIDSHPGQGATVFARVPKSLARK